MKDMGRIAVVVGLIPMGIGMHSSACVDAQSTETKLAASDAASGDRFGCSLSVSGDTAVVGARHDNDGGFDSGSAYVSVRSGTTWSQQAKLTASDAAADDNFGRSVLKNGNSCCAYTISMAYRYDPRPVNNRLIERHSMIARPSYIGSLQRRKWMVKDSNYRGEGWMLGGA